MEAIRLQRLGVHEQAVEEDIDDSRVHPFFTITSIRVGPSVRASALSSAVSKPAVVSTRSAATPKPSAILAMFIGGSLKSMPIGVSLPWKSFSRFLRIW